MLDVRDGIPDQIKRGVDCHLFRRAEAEPLDEHGEWIYRGIWPRDLALRCELRIVEVPSLSFSNSMCRGSGSDVIRVLQTSALAHGSTLWRQWRRSAIDAVVVSQPPERSLLMSVLAKGATAGLPATMSKRGGRAGAETR